MPNTIEIKITAKNAEALAALRQVANAFNDAANTVKNMGDRASAAGEKIRNIGSGDVFFGAKASGEGFLGTLSKIGMAVLGLAESLRMVKDTAEKVFGIGLSYDKQMETARMGIAGILMSMTTWNGEQMKLNKAMEISQQTLDQIQEQAVKIGLVPQDLVTGFQAILGPGLQAKMTLEEIVQLTTMGTKAVKAMLGPQGNDIQVAQELRSMVSGNIDQDSQVSRALGITNADIERAKQSAGGLFAYLKEQLSGFKALADEVWPNSMTGIIETFKAKYSQASGNAFESIFEEEKEKIKELNDALFVTDEQTKKVSFNPELLSTIKTVVDYTILFIDRITQAGRAIDSYLSTPLNEAIYLLKLVIEHATAVLSAILAWNVLSKAVALYRQVETAILACQAAMQAYRMQVTLAMGGTVTQALNAASAVSRIEAAATLAKTAIRGLASATLWGAIATAAGLVVEKIIDNFNKVDKWKQDREQAQRTNKGSDGSISWLLASHEGAGADYNAVSTGENDPYGGPSYGRYQFSSYQGVASAFVDWLISGGWDVGNFLKYSDGAFDEWGQYWPGHEITPGTEEFAERWHKAVEKYGNDFADLQDTYARMMYYDPARDYLVANHGLDPNARANAVQAAIFSTAIQHGTGGMVDVFNRAAQDYGVYNLSYLNDEDLIRAIYQARAEINPRDTARYNEEVEEAIAGLQRNTPPSRKSAGNLELKNPPQDTEALARAQVALADAIANNQLQEYIEDLKNQEQSLENKYSKTNAGTASPEESISVADYIQQKKDIATARTNAEIAYIQQQIDAKTSLMSNKNLSQADQINIQAEIEKLKSSITQKQKDLQTTLDALDNTQDAVIQAIKDEATDVIAANLENKGKLAEAELLRLAKQNRAQLEKFTVNNMPEAKQALEEDAANALNTAEFNQTQKDLEKINREIVSVETDLLQKIYSGTKNAADAIQEYSDTYSKTTQSILSKFNTELKKALDLGNETQAQQIRSQIQSLQTAIDDFYEKAIKQIQDSAQHQIDLINGDPTKTSLIKSKMVDDIQKKEYLDLAQVQITEANRLTNLTKEQKEMYFLVNKQSADFTAQTLRDAAKLNQELGKTYTLMEQVQNAGRQGLENGLVNFFEEGYRSCHKLIDAISDLAQAILTEMNKVFAQDLTRRLMIKWFPDMSSSSSSNAWTLSNGTVLDSSFGLGSINLRKFASGGHMDSGKVIGPGTETSDSILAWVGNLRKYIRISNGEYVLRGVAVRKYGKAFLDRLNQGLVPREMLRAYAVGGSLTDKSGISNILGPQELTASLTNNNSTTIPLSIMNVLDPGIMDKYLQTREGKKALLNYIKDDAGTIRRILNIRS